MSLCPVDGCSRPAHQNFAICAVHVNSLRQDLAELPSIYVALERALAPYASGVVAGGGDGPVLPYSLVVSEARSNIRAVLVGWIRDLDENPAHHPDDTVHAMCCWLGVRLDHLAGHPVAEEIVRELDEVRRAGDRAAVGPARPEPLGFCEHDGCQEPICAAPGRTFTTCRVCGTTYGVQARKDAMKLDLRGRLLTGAEIADMARYFGDVADRDKTRNLVKVWASRKLITAGGHDADGSPRYPFGEVLDMLAQVQARRAG